MTFKPGCFNEGVVVYNAHSCTYEADGTIALLDTDGDMMGQVNADVWEDAMIVQDAK